MNKFILIPLAVLFHFNAFSQSPKQVLKKLGDNPIYFVDSINVDHEELQNYDQKSIATLFVLHGKEAKENFGEAGKDGVIYIETIPFAIKRFKRYFSSKSSKYKEMITKSDSDTTVQYILNKRILTKDYEGDLAAIDDKVFKELKLLSKDELIEKYGISGKEYGVLIISSVPDDLYHGKKKF